MRTRSRLIRAFLGEFGALHHIEIWGWWRGGPDRWEIDWERLEGGPTRDDVAAAIAQRPGLGRYRDDIVLHSAAGAAIRFARATLELGRAVILDIETTDLCVSRGCSGSESLLPQFRAAICKRSDRDRCRAMVLDGRR